MSENTETALHTEMLIGDYFLLESVIVTTRTAQLYKALDKSRGSHISLWVMRQPMQLNSEAVKRFLNHLMAIQRLEPPVAAISSFGVDASGVGFCVFPALNGYPINTGNIEAAEAERRFTAAVRFVERLHSNEIVCGDLCHSSFWVERTGEIKFIGVMGSFESAFVGEQSRPETETLHFLAPEQATGAQVTRATDVFALGVLGYHLFSEKFPFAISEQAGAPGRMVVPDYGAITPVSKLLMNPVPWCDQVFERCLQSNPQERYATAGAIISAIGQIRENVFASERTPVHLHREARLVKKGDTLLPKVQSVAIKKPVAEVSTKHLGLKAGVVVAIVFLLSFVVFKELLMPTPTYNVPPGPTPPTMPDNFPVGSESEQEAYFRQLRDSDDPLAHDLLIRAARAAGDEKERVRAETALLERARRLGLRRSVEVVRPWLRGVKGDSLPESYEPMLRALDVTLPMEARSSSLRQAYASNPRIVLRLTAALAIDSEKLTEYQPVLAQLVGDASHGEDLSGRSLLGIILFSIELVPSFGDDVIQRKEKIPDKDIPWLLNLLSQRNDIFVRPIASLAVERNLLNNVRKEYLAFIRDRETLPVDVMNTLVKAASGSLEPQDIRVFGNWWDRQAEDILLTIMGDKFSKEVKVEAFDVLASKSFSKQPAASLIQWVKGHVWNDRSKFVEPIGVLSNLSLFSESDITEAVQVFEPFMKDPAILSALLESGNLPLMRLSLEKYPGKVGLGKRILLLDHSNKEVRILALRSLVGLNDVAGLKIILDHFEREKDEDVRKFYIDNFWVVQDRIKKSS